MRRILMLLLMAMAMLTCNLRVDARENAVEKTTEMSVVSKQSRAALKDIGIVKLEKIGEQIIPEAAIKENLVSNAEVIYRIRYKVTARKVNNEPVVNHRIDYVEYTGPVKGIKCTNTDSNGVGYIDVDVRGAHRITISCKLVNNNAIRSTVKSNTVTTSLTVRAKYEKPFYCTVYITTLESDYSGYKTTAAGISEDTFTKSFLDAVKLNGSGKANNGKYLQYNSSSKTFSYQTSPLTASGTKATAGRTIAVDPYYIPRAKVNSMWRRATLYIAGVGTRIAEDGGSAIVGYRIDIYMGEGKRAGYGLGNANRVVTLQTVN